MGFPLFHFAVARLVSKVAGQPLEVVDPEFNVNSYFPGSDADPDDLEVAAQECAATILFEAGYPVEG
jgi:hypothetical protein